jgi:hypothetical protein
MIYFTEIDPIIEAMMFNAYCTLPNIDIRFTIEKGKGRAAFLPAIFNSADFEFRFVDFL